MSVKFCILKNKKVEFTNSLEEAANFSSSVVAKSYFGEAEVSTIFFGGIEFDNPKFEDPIFKRAPFETMIFGGEHDGYVEKYFDYESAEKGHAKICNKFFNETINFKQ
jgi:hypothetical protein